MRRLPVGQWLHVAWASSGHGCHSPPVFPLPASARLVLVTNMLSMRSPWRWVLTVAVAPKMARCTYVRCGSRVDVTDVGVDCTSEMDVFSVRTYLVCGRCVDSWICHTHLHSVCEPVQPTYLRWPQLRETRLVELLFRQSYEPTRIEVLNRALTSYPFGCT